MSKTLFYAGIGSRQTPPDVLQMMCSIGEQLAPNWIVRSGFADGADKAFCLGAEEANGQMQIFLPWKGFNGAPDNDPRFLLIEPSEEAERLAAQFHPNWNACSRGAKALHIRNCYQVLGPDLNTPSEMVICWTPKGAGTGGTGQAIRIANEFKVPVFDLAIDLHRTLLCEYVEFIHNR